MPKDNQKRVSVEQLQQDIASLLNSSKPNSGGVATLETTLGKVWSLAQHKGFDLVVDSVDAPMLAAQQRKILEQAFRSMGFRNASIRSENKQQELLSELGKSLQNQNSGMSSGGKWSVVIHPEMDARGLSPEHVLAQADAAEKIAANKNDKVQEQNDLVLGLKMKAKLPMPSGAKPKAENDLNMTLRYTSSPSIPRPRPV